MFQFKMKSHRFRSDAASQLQLLGSGRRETHKQHRFNGILQETDWPNRSLHTPPTRYVCVCVLFSMLFLIACVVKTVC